MVSTTLNMARGEGRIDRCADAAEPQRQRARRGLLAGRRSPAYAGVTFGAGRRWVSR